jgi:hypothetical protein
MGGKMAFLYSRIKKHFEKVEAGKFEKKHKGENRANMGIMAMP